MLLKILRTRLGWMTVGEWLASLAASPSGASGWMLIFEGRPWGGVAFLAVGQILFALMMGYDMEV